MTTVARIIKRTEVRVPVRGPLGPGEKLRLALGSLLTPYYLWRAWHLETPGLRFRSAAAGLALRILARRDRALRGAEVFGLLAWPMDSVRYFEFEFAWEALAAEPAERYLDVSSPRLLPVLFAAGRPDLRVDLMNPDGADLADTERLVRSAGLASRCRLHCCVADEAPFEPSSFDVITSLSVVEHIPEDTAAVAAMWRLVKPGGRLVLSLPCAAVPEEEYIDRNEYGVLATGEGGLFFRQRFYDSDWLRSRIYAATGLPTRTAVYGEKRAGALMTMTQRKWAEPVYPYWREAATMGELFGPYNDIADLPGAGVIAMVFRKPTSDVSPGAAS